jgi:YD repeat-containing protein
MCVFNKLAIKRVGYVNFKKYLIYAVVISFLSILTLAPIHVSAATASMSLAPSSQSVTQGSTVSVAIHEDSSSDSVNSVQVLLNYPTAKLTYSSISYAGNSFDVHASESGGNGTVSLSLGKTPPAVIGDQVVATVNFLTTAAGNANISFGCSFNASTCPDGNAVLRSTDNVDILSSKTGSSLIITSIDHLVSGQSLSSGQSLVSSNVLYTLIMQGDGNLVLYGSNMKPLWYSGTSGTGANRVVMQGDGNLVIYTSGNRAVWASSTAGQGSSHLDLQGDGNLVIYNSSNVPTWHSHTGGQQAYTYNGSDRLTVGQFLTAGQYLRSQDGRCALLLQNDGNLVLYGAGYRVLWHAGTANLGAKSLVMQGDGNLVMYTSSNKPVWATTTAGHGDSFAVVQNDGNFVVYITSDNMPTFNTGTGGKIQ